MFNSELKQEFITQNTTRQVDRRRMMVFFDLVQPYEEALSKDLCTMDHDELLPIANRFFRAIRIGNLRAIIARDYIRWCVKKGVSGARNEIEELAKMNIDIVKEGTVSGPRQLQAFLDTFLDAEQLQSYDNVYRAFYWLAFSGVPFEHSLDVKVNQVDLTNLCIVIEDDVFPIYRESLPCIRNCIELDRLVRQRFENGMLVYRNRYNSDYLLRGFKSNPSRDTFLPLIGKLTDRAFTSGKTNKSLSYTKILQSGRFYRMYEDERAGFPLDLYTVIGQIFRERGNDNPSHAEMKRLERELLASYENWKQTF